MKKSTSNTNGKQTTNTIKGNKPLFNASFKAGEYEEMQSAMMDIMKFMPFLVNLDSTERQNLLKARNRNVVTMDKVSRYVKSNPEFVPAYMDVEVFERNYTLFLQLQETLNWLTQMKEKVDDTLMLCGHTSYKQALKYYKSVSACKNEDMPGVNSIYEDLHERFKANGRKKSTTTEEEGEASATNSLMVNGNDMVGLTSTTLDQNTEEN